MLPHLPFKSRLTLLFCLVDDFLSLLQHPLKLCPQAPAKLAVASILLLQKSHLEGEAALTSNNGNRAYFEAHREELLEQYPEHWVVIYQGQLVGAASNLDQLVALVDHLQDMGISISEVLVEYLNP
jgi:hypothetical protein